MKLLFNTFLITLFISSLSAKDEVKYSGFNTRNSFKAGENVEELLKLHHEDLKSFADLKSNLQNKPSKYSKKDFQTCYSWVESLILDDMADTYVYMLNNQKKMFELHSQIRQNVENISIFTDTFKKQHPNKLLAPVQHSSTLGSSGIFNLEAQPLNCSELFGTDYFAIPSTYTIFYEHGDFPISHFSVVEKGLTNNQIQNLIEYEKQLFLDKIKHREQFLSNIIDKNSENNLDYSSYLEVLNDNTMSDGMKQAIVDNVINNVGKFPINKTNLNLLNAIKKVNISNENPKYELLNAYTQAINENSSETINAFERAKSIVVKDLQNNKKLQGINDTKLQAYVESTKKYADERQSSLVKTASIALIGSSVLAVGGLATGNFATLSIAGDLIGVSGVSSEILSNSSRYKKEAIRMIDDVSSIKDDDVTALKAMQLYVPLPMLLEISPYIAQNYMKQKNYEKASEIYDLHFQFISAIRSNTINTQYRERMQANNLKNYKNALYANLKLENAENIFNLYERFSSKTLLDTMLSEKSKVDSFKENQSIKLLSNKTIDTRALKIKKDKTTAKTRSSLSMHIENIIDAKILTSKEADKIISENALEVVTIFNTDDSLGLLVKDGAQSKVYKLDISKNELKEFVSTYVDLIKSKSDSNQLNLFLKSNGVGSFLTNHLFNSEKPVMILVDESLKTFPFSALVSKNKYLIEQRELFTHVSFNIANSMKSIKNINNGKFVTFGDPYLNLGEFAQLKYAKEESIDAAKLFSSKSYIGKEATQEELKKSFEDYKVVHVAAHAFFNPTNPMLSGLVVPSKNDTNDYLYAYELYHTPVNSDTVILSACETGVSKTTNANEINGVIKPFIFHGVKDIYASLWQVDDEGSKELTLKFLQNYKDTKSSKKSLQKAVVSMIKDKKYSKAYYWAPFTLFSAI